MARILFIDDEPNVLASFLRAFRQRGHAPIGARSLADAESALEVALKALSPFDAVCTDLRLAEDDGLQVLRAVRSRFLATPVLVLTGYGNVQVSVQAMQLGAVTVLEKPITTEQLEREILAAMAAVGEKNLPEDGVDLYASLEQVEGRLIREALARSGGNKERAARWLKLNRTTLVEKLKRRGWSEM
ncbi:MAG TPA: response regulator [Polyangiaceae bacterium]|jgi:DNA-binding NtrC family response regulator|nr:response regulator [Polyangiaceae bacterium]